MVQEYNLKKMELAFSIGQKLNLNDRFPTIVDGDVIVFSEEMFDNFEKETSEVIEHTESLTNSPAPPCHVKKYAPKYGYARGNDDLLIFYEKKLEEKKYGGNTYYILKAVFIWFLFSKGLEVTFVCALSNLNWSKKLDTQDVYVKDQMVSFKTPFFPFAYHESIPVDIKLQQRDRVLENLRYFYIPESNFSNFYFDDHFFKFYIFT